MLWYVPQGISGYPRFITPWLEYELSFGTSRNSKDTQTVLAYTGQSQVCTRPRLRISLLPILQGSETVTLHYTCIENHSHIRVDGYQAHCIVTEQVYCSVLKVYRIFGNTVWMLLLMSDARCWTRLTSILRSKHLFKNWKNFYNYNILVRALDEEGSWGGRSDEDFDVGETCM